MRNPKFTPGPWRRGDFRGVVIAEALSDPSRPKRSHEEIAHDVSPGNLDLIATAPLMYAELESVAKLILDIADSLSDAINLGHPIMGSATVDPLMEVHGNLLEMLAQARGEK